MLSWITQMVLPAGFHLCERCLAASGHCYCKLSNSPRWHAHDQAHLCSSSALVHALGWGHSVRGSIQAPDLLQPRVSLCGCSEPLDLQGDSCLPTLPTCNRIAHGMLCKHRAPLCHLRWVPFGRLKSMKASSNMMRRCHQPPSTLHYVIPGCTRVKR
jgi:hypothetical protein